MCVNYIHLLSINGEQCDATFFFEITSLNLQERRKMLVLVSMLSAVAREQGHALQKSQLGRAPFLPVIAPVYTVLKQIYKGQIKISCPDSAPSN